MELRGRVENGGELALATEPLKNRVSYWTARLCAQNPETLATAKTIRLALCESQTNESLFILDALIASGEGHRDLAMKIIRDIESPDERSVMFALLLKHDGENAALAWCKGIQPSEEPGYFTHTGWTYWAQLKAQSGHWEEVAREIKVVETHIGWEPAIARIEGIVNAALILPEEHRGNLFVSIPLYRRISPNIASTAEVFRQRALDCFNFVVANIEDFVDIKTRKNINSWVLWLRLMNPNMSQAQMVQNEIRSQLENGPSGVDLAPLAWAIDLSYDFDPLRTHLIQRKLLGGLDDEELVAECFLNMQSLSAQEFASYLKENLERLNQVMDPAETTSMLIEALVKEGQMEEVQQLVESSNDQLDATTISRIKTVLALNDQVCLNRRRALEEQYEETGSLVDLDNLIAFLRETQDYTELEKRLREIFNERPTIENARELVQVMSRSAQNHQEVLSFLDGYPHQVSQDADLQSAQAWALFNAGCFNESRKVNDLLVKDRNDLNDLTLDINLGMATGDWDRLPAIVEREWSRRHELSAEVLMMMASIAAESEHSNDRAIELARLAASKCGDDPRILASAYGLHFKLGVEEEADIRWLNTAVEQSTEEGPIWALNPKELVEQWLPTIKAQNDRITRMLFAGEVPISSSLSLLNVSICQLFLGMKRHRFDQRDGRTRSLIPIVSPIRSTVTLNRDWTVGLDVSSILVLWQLDLVETVINTFGHVKLAPDAIPSLFQERSTARFHQPSRVRQAKRIRHLLDQNLIKVAATNVQLNPSVVKEFGFERAELMAQCDLTGGLLVCVKPLRKSASIDLQVADLSKFDGLLCSPADVCELLRRSGIVSSDTCDRALSFLENLGQVPNAELPDTFPNGPVFMDETALSYLHSAQILDELARTDLDLYVHQCVSDETNALLATDEDSDDLVDEIEGNRFSTAERG